MLKKVKFAVLLASLLGTAGIAGAGGGLSGGSTEVTQLANNAELVAVAQNGVQQVQNQIRQITHEIEMITNQVTMIQDMVRNTLSLPNQLFGDIMGSVDEVKNVLARTQGVAHSLGDIDGLFKSRFWTPAQMTGMKTTTDFQKEYSTIQETQRETIRSSMNATGVIYDQYTSDADLLKQLQEKAGSAEGRNQLLQMELQLMAFSSRQLLRLQELSMMQMTNYGATLEAERAKEDMAKEQDAKAWDASKIPHYGPAPLNTSKW
ncbi:MAG: P-type conjugative transfer protein TrbJ [Synergistaceae bacterium]|jgi:P-type conjugative transfer protein TrbJ|nr:P-type conjugative transfer protein TrbJ [Synergistaceae bacterium]